MELFFKSSSFLVFLKILAFPKKLYAFHDESNTPCLGKQIKESQTRFLIVAGRFASRFTRPDHLKRPEF